MPGLHVTRSNLFKKVLTDMETVNHLPLTDAAYNTDAKLRNWNCRTTALRCRDDKTAAKLIGKFRPYLTPAAHSSISTYHAVRAKKLLDVWRKVVDRAALEAFNRPWRFTDYEISGICSDQFAEKHKRVLRHCIHGHHTHDDMSRAHAILAKLRPKAHSTASSRP